MDLPTGMNTIPIMIYTAMTHLGSRRGCQDRIRCCVKAVSEGMRLNAPSAAASAGASACAALSTVDTALMDGAEGNVWACAIDRDYPTARGNELVGADKGSACRGTIGTS